MNNNYTVLDRGLNVLGILSLENNAGNTTFWGDTITQQIADDGQNDDPTTLLSQTMNSIDSKANHKLWNHTLSINFEETNTIGKPFDSGYYLLYQDTSNNKNYLMNMYDVTEDSNGVIKFKTANGNNSAIYDASHAIVVGKTFTNVNLSTIVSYIADFIGWSFVVNSDDSVKLDSYTIDDNATVMAVIQDLIIKFDTEVDAYVTLNGGRIQKRVIEFGELGENNGQFIVYGSQNKGFESITQQWTSDTVYTKLHVKGANDATFASINQGNDYIVDDEANRIYNPINASLATPRYLETTITNELLSEPQALLDWANKQIQLLNHPRANYTVSTLHDTVGALGDTIKVQDRTASPVISLSSRVIQKVTSFASPETNQLTLGEFSAVSFRKTVASEIVNINTNINDVTQIANNAKDTADDAKITSELAKKKADEANQNAQTASQKIDATMATERSRVNGLLDQQTTKIQGVVKEASDYTDSAKAEVLNKAQSLADEAKNGAVAQSKVDIDSITNWVKDGDGNLSSSMMTALFNTTALKDFDKNSSVKSQTANMISSAVSDSENGMRSLISQKADSTVIGTISEDVNTLKQSTQWEQIAYDDVNFLKSQGNYLITSGAGTNSPIKPWFYITVDAPRGDRITQHIWKDLDASMSYSRIFDGSNWSAWIQIANSSTLLSIFNDQWSLGTYINTSIGQKIATGISGLPDGTLALTGRSIHLTGDTIIDGSFMTKALSTQDATIGKTLTLGSGGKFVSSGLSSAFNSYIIGMATGYGRVASPYAMGISTTGGVTIDENGYNYSATYDTWLQSTSSTWTEYKGTLNVSLTSGSLVLTENTTSAGMKGETTINAGSSKWAWSGSGIIDGYTYIDGLSLLISGASDNPKQTYITKDTIGTGGSVYGSTVSSNGLKLDTSSALVGTTSNTIFLQPYQYENAGFTFRYISSASVNTHTIQLTGKGNTLKFVNDANGSDDWSSDATVTAGKIASTSTRASKVNIEDISSDDIDKILSVNPRTFNKLQNLEAVKSEIEGTNDSYTQSDLKHMLDKEYGFVIEELQEVGLSGGIFSYDEDGNAVALAYDRLTALLLGAIKRQQSEKAELELKVAKLETQVAKILEKIGD